MTELQKVLQELARLVTPLVLEQINIHPSTHGPEKPMSLVEMADFLGLSKSSLAQMASRQEVPHFRAGRRLFFSPTEVLVSLRIPCNAGRETDGL